MDDARSILIADDETPARSELRYILEMLAPEATFYEAANGEEALELVEREPIDVAFLDIHMPGLDGLETAATIVEGPEPPLIVFATAYDEHALTRRADSYNLIPCFTKRGECLRIP